MEPWHLLMGSSGNQLLQLWLLTNNSLFQGMTLDSGKRGELNYILSYAMKITIT